ncbi:MAG: tetratricopeptide repeat protein [Planctomycetota bacterium]|nr:tetratricopeptide repeat protein [Planctomycetota bacterium]
MLTSAEPAEASASQRPALANPENQELEIALATAQLAEERAMDAEAIAAYEKVRQLNPNQPGVAHSLAVLYDRREMTDAAQREYAAALAESPQNVNVLCDYGYFLYSAGRLPEAEQALREAVSVDPAHRTSSVNLAVVLATQGQYGEARPLFEKAIGPAAALHNIGIFKLRQGQTAEGQGMIAEALQMDPSLKQSMAVLDNLTAAN